MSIQGGVADIDVNGDGVADDASALAALGISAEERASLANVYAAGERRQGHRRQGFWGARVSMTSGQVSRRPLESGRSAARS